MTARTATILALAQVVVGCAVRGTAGDETAVEAICETGAVECEGVLARACEDGEWATVGDCAALGRVCVEGLGCTVCSPGDTACSGQSRMVCAADGTGWETESECPLHLGLTCDPSSAECVPFCDEEVGSSNVGCEYWATPTLNSFLAEEFSFAVIVANTREQPARVVVERDGRIVAEGVVDADSTESFVLPWITEVKGPLGYGSDIYSSRVESGSYRVRSTAPVIAYQFNPLEFSLPMDCFLDWDETSDGHCNSYSNDASLLLPTHVLGNDYLVVSREHASGRGGTEVRELPGFATIVAVEEGETRVEVTPTARVRASFDGELAAMAAGETAVVTLGQGDVLQLVTDPPASCPRDSSGRCHLSSEYDLTGTRIHTDAPVAVFGGHNCTEIPTGEQACDHLEESMLPLETWGRELVVPALHPLPNLLRVVSGADGNVIELEPPVHASVILDAGEHFEVEIDRDVVVRATEAITGAQFMMGEGHVGSGDPAMTLIVPAEQFLPKYVFHVSETFTESWITISATPGQAVLLDGVRVEELAAIGDTGFAAARVPVGGGLHTIDSPLPFGIQVNGTASYTSYVYPGGLALEEINPLF